jgi:hypothetical protein
MGGRFDAGEEGWEGETASEYTIAPLHNLLAESICVGGDEGMEAPIDIGDIKNVAGSQELENIEYQLSRKLVKTTRLMFITRPSCPLALYTLSAFRMQRDGGCLVFEGSNVVKVVVAAAVPTRLHIEVQKMFV